MLPCSTRQILDYVPIEYGEEAKADAAERGEDLSRFDQPPTYKLGIPSKLAKTEVDHALREAGVVGVSRDELTQALREAIAEVVAEELQAEALALVDGLQVAQQLEDEEARKAVWTDVQARALAKIERLCLTHSPAYASVAAHYERYWPWLKYVALQHMLRGWAHVRSAEGVPIPFKLHRGVASPESLDAIPATHFAELSLKALSLLYPSEPEKKDSGSPSPSPATPATS